MIVAEGGWGVGVRFIFADDVRLLRESIYASFRRIKQNNYPKKMQYGKKVRNGEHLGVQ